MAGADQSELPKTALVLLSYNQYYTGFISLVLYTIDRIIIGIPLIAPTTIADRFSLDPRAFMAFVLRLIAEAFEALVDSPITRRFGGQMDSLVRHNI